LANAILAATTSLEAQGAHTQLGSVGFCHGDIRLSNLRVSGEQVVFFDFDDCGIGHQLLDVAAMAFWLEVGDQKNPQDLWRAFLEGYGVQSSSSTNLAIQWLVLEHQVRAFQWLIDYCALTDELWQKVTQDAISIVELAKSGTLKVLQT
jgi:Ser/Thr protein kinase RdoA (MazF antagonist)